MGAAIFTIFIRYIFSQNLIHAGQAIGINPALDFGEVVPLTTVVCLGAGTLHIDLIKDNTENELVVMLVTGFPTDPLFIPSMDITPAEINVRTEIDPMLGGFGIVFIFSGINASESRTYEISLALEE